MRKYMIILIGCLYFCIPAFSQDDYLQKGDDCFDNGDYECAISNYKSYQVISGEDAKAKIEKSENCFKIRILADAYFEEEEYEKARKQYEKILDINTVDPYVRKRYNQTALIVGANLTDSMNIATETRNTLKVSEESIIASARPEYKVIVFSNTSWSVLSNKSWCTVAPSSKMYNGEKEIASEVSIRLEYNTSGADREAVLRVMTDNIVREIKVVQPYYEIDMVQVQAGIFVRNGYQIALSSYKIGKYEITQKQWVDVMGNNPSYYKGDDLPVTNVSWKDVQIFIAKLNSSTGKKYRLPTEAEWEFAARGGNDSKGYKYAGSNTLNQVAWYNVNKGEHYPLHPVGQKQPNELGLYDMSGNVAEWCSDWYAQDYPENDQTNPNGPVSGTKRVIRGGDSGASDYRCLVSRRDCASPDDTYHTESFRAYYDEKEDTRMHYGFRLCL